MNKSVKTRWTAALRSGDYPQTKGCLRDDNGFCCLGVLEDLAERDGVVTRHRDSVHQSDNPGAQMYADPLNSNDRSWIGLTRATQEWAGLSQSSPKVADSFLSDLNDRGSTFREIADLIDKYL